MGVRWSQAHPNRSSGPFHLKLPMKTAPIWRVGDPLLCCIVSRVRLVRGGGEPPPLPPQGDSHHGPLPGLARGIGCVHVYHRLTRAAGDPHQDPQNKVKRSTSGPFHLNLRGRGNDCRSRAEARGSSRKVPVRRRYTDFASSRSSRETLSPPGTEDSREAAKIAKDGVTIPRASRLRARAREVMGGHMKY